MRTSNNYPELKEMLIELASIIKADDLEDAAVLAKVQQLVGILKPSPEPLPAEVIQELLSTENKEDRFQMAVQMMGAKTPEDLQRLADSMKMHDLLNK